MDDLEYLEPLSISEPTSTTLLEYPYEQFLMKLRNIDKTTKLSYLEDSKFLDKLFLLDDAYTSVWKFESVASIYSLKDLLPYMQGEFLERLMHRPDQKAYVYIIAFIRSDVVAFQKGIFASEAFLNFFLGQAKNIYSELNFDFDFCLKLINYAFENNIYIESIVLNSLAINIKEEDQKRFLDGIKDNATKIRLLEYFAPQVVEDYIKNNSLGLNDGEVYGLMHHFAVPTAYYENPNFFKRYIMSLTFSKMDEKIAALSKHNNVSYLRNQKENLMDSLMASFDSTTNQIKMPPDDDSILSSYLKGFFNYYSRLEVMQATKTLILNLVINRLFGDTLKNVFLNIKEMLNYNEKAETEVLTIAEVELFSQVLDLINKDSKEILTFYEQFKNADIMGMFYDAMRKSKNASYKQIQESCLDLKEHAELKNATLSETLGIGVYELKGEDFMALVSCQHHLNGDFAHRYRKCYSLIGSTNLSVFNEHSLIYGFRNFNIANISHVFEMDAGSGDSLTGGVTPYVNRIQRPEDILASGVMNEIQIKNGYDADHNKFLQVKPDYIVCFDSINPSSIEEAQKKNLPIVVIHKKDYELKEGQFLSNMTEYVPSGMDFEEENNLGGLKI